MNNLIKFMLFMTIIINNFVFDIEICSLHVWLIPILWVLIITNENIWNSLCKERHKMGASFGRNIAI